MFSICEDRFDSETAPADCLESWETRLCFGGDDGPAPGDCGRFEYKFCLAGDATPPGDRELLKDEFPASSSTGDVDFFFAKESAAVVGGDGE